MINTENRLNILCSQRWRSSIQSAKTRPGADCGSDHEETSDKLKLRDILQISQTILFKSDKVLEVKERLRNSSRLNVTKET